MIHDSSPLWELPAAFGGAIPSAHGASGPLCSEDWVFGCPVFFETPESSARAPSRHDSALWLSDFSNLRALSNGRGCWRVRWDRVWTWAGR